MMAEIRDANLSYLMLAQQMIRADKVTAIFRLGIAADIADLIEGMALAIQSLELRSVLRKAVSQQHLESGDIELF